MAPQSKASLFDQFGDWFKEMARALEVALQAADVEKRQKEAAEKAQQEWDNAVAEVAGKPNRSERVDEYVRKAGFDPNADQDKKTPGVQTVEWCGAFAGFSLAQSGFKDSPHMASFQKARDYFVYRSFTGAIKNEEYDKKRAEQEASGSTRKLFLLEGSESQMATDAERDVKNGKGKYSHFDPAKNTFNYQELPIQPGDVALFKRNKGHVGMVKSYDRTTGMLETIEGNAAGLVKSGVEATGDAVVQRKYDLSKEAVRKEFDSFGRPAAGDFQDPVAKRTVNGSGGFVYEQHSDGKIFIIKSPKSGNKRAEVKDRKALDAILAEIGDFPKPTAGAAW